MQPQPSTLTLASTRSTRFTLIVLLALAASALALAPPSAAQVRGCPYDLRAMCCTESSSGKCNEEQNCCELYEGSSQPDAAGGTAALWSADLPIRDQPSRCEQDCQRVLDDPADIKLCIEHCALLDVLPGPPVLSEKAPPWRPVRLVQLGGFRANVPMHYVAWFPNHPDQELEQRVHLLAPSTHGNLDAPFRIEVSCSPGVALEYLALQVPKQPLLTLVDGGTDDHYSDDPLILQPFPRSLLGPSCSEALGGEWTVGDGHPDVEPVETTWIESTLVVAHRCAGQATVITPFEAITKARCIDQFDDYQVP